MLYVYVYKFINKRFLIITLILKYLYNATFSRIYYFYINKFSNKYSKWH